MKIEQLIITLIQQDIKHNQLLQGLRSIGLKTDEYQLSIVNIVESLMNIDSGKANDTWNSVYFSFMELGQKYPVSKSEDELRNLAEECYKLLSACGKCDV